MQLLAPYVGPPVVRHESRRPVEIWTSPAGRTLVDFGQNLVGWLRFTVRGEAGQEITLRHAEVLEDGELGVRTLRTAHATDRFVLSGGDDLFEPTKTFHGFRYAEVTGWPTETAGELTAESLEAVVVHSELRRTGHFECSDDLLNQLHSNAVWGLRGNFLDVPTDCPQRDERLGWTGDIAVFAPSAAFLYDVRDFLRDWLVDVGLEQRAQDGLVPFVVPDVLKYMEHPKEFPAPETAAIWSDAAVWVPWALWQAYGDLTVLEDQYDSMAAHVTRVESLLSPSGLWDKGFQFGDWLDPQAHPDRPFEAKADNGVVATACLYRTARMVADAAALTGREEDAARFGALADRTREAFNKHYVHDIDGADGTITSDAPSVYALAIAFDMLDDDDRRRAGDRLAELAAENGYHVATGFAGTAFITDALSRHGASRRGVPAAPAADLPLVALPGDHGCDHHLGALGLDAARRHHQPRRDDQLQPLRPRRRRRLDAPHHRRDRSPRARLPPRPDRAPPRRRPDLGVDQPGDGARARQLTLAHRRRRPDARRRPSRRRHRRWCRCPGSRTSRSWGRHAT